MDNWINRPIKFSIALHINLFNLQSQKIMSSLRIHHDTTSALFLLFFLLLSLQSSFAIRARLTSSVSPIDTVNDCYWSNRIYQKELRAEEEHSLTLNLLEEAEAASTHLRRSHTRAHTHAHVGGGCMSQKTKNECAKYSQLEYKNTRKALAQCGYCIKDSEEKCFGCDVIRAQEKQGWLCAPDTMQCHHPTDERGIDAKKKVEDKEQEPPAPDDLSACATTPGAEPCEVNDKKYEISKQNKNNSPLPLKEMDPRLPVPDLAPAAPDPAAKKPKPDDPVAPEEKNTGEQNEYDETIRWGSAVLPWNMYQWCERLLKEMSTYISSDELRKAESPSADFTASCLGMFGNVCLPQCRTVANLYDEIARPGEYGGMKGGEEEGRWDVDRGIPMAPTYDYKKRTLVYRLSQEDCVKCLKEDDCVPDCMLDSSCVGEGDEIVQDTDMDETMPGKG